MLTATNAAQLREALKVIGFPQRHQRSSIYAKTETASAAKNPTLIEQLEAFETASKELTVDQKKDFLLKTFAKPGMTGLQEWAEAVRYKVQKDYLANTFVMNAFFEQVSLVNEQFPIIETRIRDGKFRFTTLGQNGGMPKRQYVENVSRIFPHLERFGSVWKEYQLMNLQTGDVSASEEVQQELSYEFRREIDDLARALLDDTANYMTSGLRATLNLHPSIVAANIPDANHLDLNGVDTAGEFSVEKLKQILEYFVFFSSDVEYDGRGLELKTMFISPQNRRDFWDFATLVAGFNLSGAIQNPKDVIPAEADVQIWRTGELGSAYGHTFATVARNTIAKGTVYCASNKPLGYYFHKPGMGGTVFGDQGEKALLKNQGQIAQYVTHVFVVPQPWAYRYLRVTL